MADVAAQREARRRKITENANARMNKLLGLTKNTDQKNESPLQDFDTDQNNESSKQNSDSRSQLLEEQPYSMRLRSKRSAVSQYSTSEQSPDYDTHIATVDKSSNRQPDDPIAATLNTMTKIIPAGIAESTQQISTYKSDVSANSIDSLPQIVQALDAKRLEIIKIVVLAVTAFLARFVLKFGFGLLLVQSIFVPFVLLETAFEYLICKYLQHLSLFTSNGGLISAALMLCGLQQEALDTYNNIIGHITSVSSDFCLYLFSFILWNTLII